MKQQIKSGAMIAYMNILINMFISVFLTPFIIGKLGSSEYGVYKIVSSFSAYLGVISFGIATLVTRNVVYYDTKGLQREKENFLFMAEIESAILACIVLLCGTGLYIAIEPLYGNALSRFEIELAKKLFVFLVLDVACNVLCDAFTGMIKAHEKFVVSNLICTFRYVLRLVSLIVLLNSGVKAIGIVITDLGISVLVFITSVFFSKAILKEKARFYYFDKLMLKSGLSFSMAIFLQAIINQVNNNLDNVILGAMEGTEVVTVYSVALTMFGVFNTFVTVVGSMYGPSATRLVTNGATGRELTEFAIKPARIQAMIALLGIIGFALVGKDFIYLWLGDEFADVYVITLILIIPVVLPLIESITNSILDAMLKRMARSIILAIMCVVNLLVSVFLIKQIGYIGAAFGTAFSLIVGHGIIMNIYLHKKIGLNIPGLFKGVFKGIFLCAILTLVMGNFVTLLPTSWVWLILKGIIVVLIYGILLYFIGINAEEKKTIKTYARKMISKID